MNLVLRPAAAADIEHAHAWYHERSASLADRYLDAVQDALARITERPLAYAVVHRDTRRIRLRRFPYCVYYTIRSDQLVIVACMHAKRAPRRWRSRADV